MARTRKDRQNDFDEFFRTVKATFTEFRDNDLRAKEFQNIYMLNICPGSRDGGTNNRVVEIFWGSRPFETIQQGRNWASSTEYGATLLYQRDDSGFVIVSIYPANTDNKKPIENSITLDIWLDPIKLKNKSYLKKNWIDFMAYMENTSLDGNPTYMQRQRVFYLRTFKNLIIDNKWTPTKFSIFGKDVLKWVLTVGLSGIIVYIVTLATQSIKTTSSTKVKTEIQLNEMNQNLKNISKQLDKVAESNNDIKSVSNATDSINLKMRQIVKIIDKHK